VKTRGLLALILLEVACARPRPEPAVGPRVKDSVPERAASLRSADGLHADDEEARWGVEGARERKRQEAERGENAGRTVVIPMPAPNDSGAFGRSDGGLKWQ
jgi:hypothetical protein